MTVWWIMGSFVLIGIAVFGYLSRTKVNKGVYEADQKGINNVLVGMKETVDTGLKNMDGKIDLITNHIQATIKDFMTESRYQTNEQWKIINEVKDIATRVDERSKKEKG